MFVIFIVDALELSLAYLKKVGYTSETVAIIEFEDRVACIYPWEVKFVDEENHELHCMNEHERKEKSDEL